ncbi:glycosyltransferase family 4 protein [Levilactobacillus namurensis]|uniref:Glycosyltransferase family 4 protein n=1 Tax=Levilactobacillus namurensis TaxID=380393 RepID=A0AAW8W7Z4_9LACO|nr:glycosyltransferase family 4 protein [Levilactobacillus namurensis]MDT7014844.1 glycosyltransferase family 4 protein [Levilactobacillus namurensis]
MLKINMFSAADSVKGQGVGSAYNELMNLMKTHLQDDFDVTVNRYGKADITHYHTINFSYYLSTFLPGRGRKIGYVHFLPETLEGSLKIPQPFRGIFYRYVIAFYKRMDHIVVVNPTFIPKLAAYGIPAERVTYIPNFVSRQEFYPVEPTQKLTLRQQYGYDAHRFTVLGIGQIQERKGLFDFIKLARNNPKIQFIWAGGFSFGRITDGYADLKKVVDDPPANLSFPGIVDRAKLVDYYDLADLFLLPSFNELFPMSVLEAFSTGTPVMLRDLELYHAIIAGDYIPAQDYAEMNAQLQTLPGNRAALDQWRQKSLAAAERYSEAHLTTIWRRFYRAQAKEG